MSFKFLNRSSLYRYIKWNASHALQWAITSTETFEFVQKSFLLKSERFFLSFNKTISITLRQQLLFGVCWCKIKNKVLGMIKYCIVLYCISISPLLKHVLFSHPISGISIKCLNFMCSQEPVLASFTFYPYRKAYAECRAVVLVAYKYTGINITVNSSPFVDEICLLSIQGSRFDRNLAL